MLKVISITIADTVIEAVLNDSPTAQLVFDSLPLEGTVNVWGEEIYFIFPLKAELEAEAPQLSDSSTEVLIPQFGPTVQFIMVFINIR
ncbi:MAG: cyclophilin-like family protein, partial [Thermodesulfobacteriota bacterium]|nr:cyclophilin-like family protein [Thermodesulfobacteriota bacterium]